MDENNTDGHLFGLANPDLVLIKPNYEAMIKGGQLKITEMGVEYAGKSEWFLSILSLPLKHITKNLFCIFVDYILYKKKTTFTSQKRKKHITFLIRNCLILSELLSLSYHKQFSNSQTRCSSQVRNVL